MNTPIILLILAAIFSFTPVIFAKEQLNIENCISMARVNYPLYKNMRLIEETLRLNLEKANMAFIPNIKFSSKVSYQSDVPQIPVSIPGYGISVNNDQYQFVAELSQPIFDGGVLWASKDTFRAKMLSDTAQLEVQLYNIQNSVMNVYFGILLIDEQLAQNELYLTQLRLNYTTIENYLKNGVAQPSDLDKISVEELNALKNKDDMLSKKEAYLDALGQFINDDPRKFALAIPDKTDKLSELHTLLNETNYQPLLERLQFRPEVAYYNALAHEVDITKKSNLVKGLPTLDVFIQGGYSNPGLNFLKSGFTPYYMAGVRLNWNFTGLYTQGKENEVIIKKKLQLLAQKEEFLFNSKIAIEDNIRAIESLQKQLNADDKIIELRTSIVKASEAKIRNGVMTVNDLLTDINNLNTARQEKSYRTMMLLMKIYSLKQTLNIWETSAN